MNNEQAPQENQVSNNAQKFCKMCGNGMCCGHRHFWLRWLLGIIILATVFCIGVKIGEFKGAFGGNFYNRGGNNTRFFQSGYPNGMMRQGYQPGTYTATTTPAK